MPKASNEIDFNRLALDTAKLSPAQKRKVGAVIVQLCQTPNYACGYNSHPEGKPCELEDGSTDPAVEHAEIAALNSYKRLHGCLPTNGTVYVTHEPCAACQDVLQRAGVIEVIVVDAFMKFDSEKLRFELIPPSATNALASILTYGARKYKPNNWKKGEVDRYVGAAMRHFEAYRAGEYYDEESGLPHLHMLLTNAAFLVELDPPEDHPER